MFRTVQLSIITSFSRYT